MYPICENIFPQHKSAAWINPFFSLPTFPPPCHAHYSLRSNMQQVNPVNQLSRTAQPSFRHHPTPSGQLTGGKRSNHSKLLMASLELISETLNVIGADEKLQQAGSLCSFLSITLICLVENFWRVSVVQRDIWKSQ